MNKKYRINKNIYFNHKKGKFLSEESIVNASFDLPKGCKEKTCLYNCKGMIENTRLCVSKMLDKDILVPVSMVKKYEGDK
ncbi:MAG: hypothetical protein ACQEQF_07110 [Bacillota bacterium]